MRKSSRNRGFTLIEIMIVILVISTLTAISVPNFLTARGTSQRTTCMANLKKLDAAKEQWAMESHQKQGAPADMADLTTNGYLNGPATGPTCPAGGSYSVNPVG